MSSITSTLALFASNLSQTSSTTTQDQSSGDLFGAAFAVSLGDNSDSTSASTTTGSSQGSSGGFEALLFGFTSAASDPSSTSTDTSDSSDTADAAAGSAAAAANAPTDSLDQIFNMLQQMVTDAENTLENIGSTTTGTTDTQTASSVTDPFASSDTSTSFAENALASGGPLPTFLAQVDSEMGLDSTQQAALQNIATQYQNANNTPDTVASIAGALQQAGISETI